MNATEVSTPTTSFGYYNVVRNRERPFPIEDEKKEARWYHYKLESESSPEDSEGDESTYSVQGKETDLAKDTSDTDWSSEESAIEFEIQSSENEQIELGSQVITGDGSSDTEEDIVATTLISITMLENDDFSSAGSEDSVASTDSEISRKDYWKCIQCKNSNNNPMFRYCEKCYKVRKDFFPPRPRRKRPKKGKKQKYQTSSSTASSKPKMETVLEESDNFNKSKSVSPKFDFKNIIVPSVNAVSQPQFQNSNSLFPNLNEKEINEPLKVLNRKRPSECEIDETNKKRKKDDECNISVINVNKNIISKNFDMDPVIDLGISAINDTVTSFSQPLFPTYVDKPTKMRSESFLEFCKDDMEVIPENHFSENENTAVKNPSKKVPISRQDSDGLDTKNCIICMTEPRTGIFVHGRIAHICCCYRCSVQVWTKTKRCPACNCKVSNVLRAFHV